MIYLIGLGLSGVLDLTLKAVRHLKDCKKIFLEAYTSVVFDSDGCRNLLSELKEVLNIDAEFITADREMVESADEIIDSAKRDNVAVLVVGDPLSATTHTDLLLRAAREGVQYEVIHNTSIMTAVGVCGLHLYNYGVTVSIPFWDIYNRPTSFFDKIVENAERGLHTLCLLDIKVKERSIENLLRDRDIYEAPRFMSCSTAAEQLLEIIKNSNDRSNCISQHTLCIGLARVSSDSQSIYACTLEEMLTDRSRKVLGGPQHSMVIVGKCQPLELEYVSHISRIPFDTITRLYERHFEGLYKRQTDK